MPTIMTKVFINNIKRTKETPTKLTKLPGTQTFVNSVDDFIERFK